jgi:hypothetical protein
VGVLEIPSPSHWDYVTLGGTLYDVHILTLVGSVFIIESSITQCSNNHPGNGSATSKSDDADMIVNMLDFVVCLKNIGIGMYSTRLQ